MHCSLSAVSLLLFSSCAGAPGDRGVLVRVLFVLLFCSFPVSLCVLVSCFSVFFLVCRELARRGCCCVRCASLFLFFSVCFVPCAVLCVCVLCGQTRTSRAVRVCGCSFFLFAQAALLLCSFHRDVKQGRLFSFFSRCFIFCFLSVFCTGQGTAEKSAFS